MSTKGSNNKQECEVRGLRKTERVGQDKETHSVWKSGNDVTNIYNTGKV